MKIYTHSIRCIALAIKLKISHVKFVRASKFDDLQKVMLYFGRLLQSHSLIVIYQALEEEFHSIIIVTEVLASIDALIAIFEALNRSYLRESWKYFVTTSNYIPSVMKI